MGKVETVASSTEMAFNLEQRFILSTLERVGGALSLFGVVLIFITFYMSKRIRTVPNTFILFASIANIGASVASLIALAGIEQGEDSGLCQTQAFLFEMFMQSDPWWSFAMAVNVYLVFFWAANPTSFRRYLWVYCAVCFGVPAIPAFICLFLKPGGKPIYGDAILWCWIDNEFNQLRIYTYYLPIWVCIFLSALIYFAVGYQVFHQRNQLRNLTLSNPGKETSTSDVRDSAEKHNMASHASYYGTVTTEVQVTSTENCCDTHTSAHSLTPPPTPGIPNSSATHNTVCYHPWASTPAFGMDEESGPSGDAQRPMSPCSNPACSAAPTPIPSVIFPIPPPGQQHHTGPPSTSTAFQTTSVTVSSSPPTKRPPLPSALHRVRSSAHRFGGKLRHMDPVKLAYLRTSFVFAISVLVTWTPSSINRVYNLIHPDEVSYPLNIASAAVLPLQGVWNAVIYFSTSWRILLEELEVFAAPRPALRGVLTAMRVLPPVTMTSPGDVGERARFGSGAFVPGSPGRRDEDPLDRPLGGMMSRQCTADMVEMSPRGQRMSNSNVRIQRGGDLDFGL